MADLVRLTVVPNRGEADIVCSLLRVNGIACVDHVIPFGEAVTDFGTWREILVGRDDLEAARELIQP